MHTGASIKNVYSAHRGQQGSTLECAHFCLPGVPAVWVYYLTKALQPLNLA